MSTIRKGFVGALILTSAMLAVIAGLHVPTVTHAMTALLTWDIPLPAGLLTWDKPSP